MRITVTDACIFIDLIELNLISDFFQLDLEFHTTVEVLNELFQEQKQVLEAYKDAKKLAVHNLHEEDFSKMEQFHFPKGLSQEDRSVIYIAIQLKAEIVLSSDKLVTKCADSHHLEYHGLLWVFDLLVDNDICSKGKAVSSLQYLLKLNSMYTTSRMKKEIDVRIKKWGE
ncbi:PIN domain-containing protein [Belliella pelovolcani]|uniref:PIN domain-containing protein n=1 Tax=Belliella pelovolcani TaxID=529505 RepID=A0A1N7Q2C1_9BACT|nr:PIN domain-containing protein [Belliella pelovolcani]SIT17033.1 hypothetical protein SAMN05421761_1265 [Belliella pelovolcani]